MEDIVNFCLKALFVIALLVVFWGIWKGISYCMTNPAKRYTIEVVDSHEYICSKVWGGRVFTHSASCKFCYKDSVK